MNPGQRYLIFKHRSGAEEAANDVYDCYESKAAESPVAAVAEILEKYPDKLAAEDWLLVVPVNTSYQQSVTWIKVEHSTQLTPVGHPEADFLKDTARR